MSTFMGRKHPPTAKSDNETTVLQLLQWVPSQIGGGGQYAALEDRVP